MRLITFPRYKKVKYVSFFPYGKGKRLRSNIAFSMPNFYENIEKDGFEGREGEEEGGG